KSETSKTRPFATQRQHLLPGLGVPQFDRLLVVAAGRQPPIIRRKRNGMRPELEAFECWQRLEPLHIPEWNHARRISRRCHPAIRRASPIIQLEPAQQAGRLARSPIPESDRLVCAGGDLGVPISISNAVKIVLSVRCWPSVALAIPKSMTLGASVPSC